MILKDVKQRIDQCNEEQRKDVLQYVRQYIDIHPLEKQLNCSAEIILEAIQRAPDITVRGIRGIIAEATFKIEIIDQLTSWTNVCLVGQLPYDFLIKDGDRQITIQVKLQRKAKQNPLERNGKWVVETQKTRSGNKDGKKTRPYQFGEFDILAVSLQPSANIWNKFMYTISSWLIPHKENANFLRTLQPVSKIPDDEWTDNLETCIDWHFSNITKILSDFPPTPKRQKQNKQIV